MTDWNAIARARALNIPQDTIDRIAPALDGLEDAFRPLLTKLTHSTEPAVTLSAAAVLGE
ncbi:MAG: hypothetical protein ABSB15_06460 [Bryobacteraceae bacterium]|jgi:hypothetical protein